MKEKYLIVNAGSSSLKFSLYDMPSKNELIKGNIEKIGLEDSFWTLKSSDTKIQGSKPLKNHSEAVEVMVEELIKSGVINSIDEVKGIGHRVLHGGEYFSDSKIIDDDVIDKIKLLTKFGPLHHPGEIAGIEAMKNKLPEIDMVAVFDTAFHQTICEKNYIYPVPINWYEDYSVRKYGFHGTSHKYITNYMKEKLNKEDINIISCHIGSGASIAAIKDGKSYDTTMGLTPLAGLMMGTRCGDIDPSIIEYMIKYATKDIEDINYELNNKSGLLGISGNSDLRDVRKKAMAGDKKAILALEIYKRNIIKYIAEYYFELEGNVDALVFTAGVGENDSLIREEILNVIGKPMGITVNKEINDKVASFKEIQTAKISSDNSKIDVYVIPTNEEVVILEDTYNLIKDKNKVKKLVK